MALELGVLTGNEAVEISVDPAENNPAEEKKFAQQFVEPEVLLPAMLSVSTGGGIRGVHDRLSAQALGQVAKELGNVIDELRDRQSVGRGEVRRSLHRMHPLLGYRFASAFQILRDRFHNGTALS